MGKRLIAAVLTDSINRKRSREERASKVVQGIRQRLKAGHLPDRKKRKGILRRSPMSR
jgi:hypothetical protein